MENHKYHILIAEDDPNVEGPLRAYIEGNLYKLGITNVEVISVATRQAALDVIDSDTDLCLVISDLHMDQGGDGNHIVPRAFAKFGQDQHKGVVLFTGTPKDVSDEVRVMLELSGYDAVSDQIKLKAVPHDTVEQEVDAVRCDFVLKPDVKEVLPLVLKRVMKWIELIRTFGANKDKPARPDFPEYTI